MTEYLIHTGVHPDQHDKAGWTAIMWAAANGQLDTVRQLHRAGVDLARLSRGNWNVLMLAVHSGNANVVSYLLDKGSDPNQPNHLGESAASYAENLAKSSKEAGDGDSALAFQRIGQILLGASSADSRTEL